MHRELGIPVYGLCDCNPYGLSVMSTYRRGSEKMGLDGGERFGVPIGILGLRPSQLKRLGDDDGRDEYREDAEDSEDDGGGTSPASTR